MKKIIAMLLAFILIFACLVLTGCDKEPITYTATSEFYYSADKGVTYGNRRKEYTVGETIYMQLVVTVTSTSKSTEAVSVRLSIPNITSIDAKYYDGQVITPSYDAIQNVTIYDFTVAANNSPTEWNFFFQFTPNKEAAGAEVSMTLVFDDHIDPMYDKLNTIKFVAPTQEEGE